jgi:hypothetical protein
VSLLQCCLQDIGEGLLALLHYPERQQLVAVTSSGSAMVLGSSSTGSPAIAAEWGVLMRVKFAGVNGSAKLQVETADSSSCMQVMNILPRALSYTGPTSGANYRVLMYLAATVLAAIC